MDKKVLIFTVVFVFSLTILLYYLGTSITGYATAPGASVPAKERAGFYAFLVMLIIIVGVTYFSKRKEYFA